METVIALLKAAVVEFERGTVASGDKLLDAAVKFRKETQKAQRLVPVGSPQKP